MKSSNNTNKLNYTTLENVEFFFHKVDVIHKSAVPVENAKPHGCAGENGHNWWTNNSEGERKRSLPMRMVRKKCHLLRRHRQSPF